MDPVGKKNGGGNEVLSNKKRVKGGDQERKYRARSVGEPAQARESQTEPKPIWRSRKGSERLTVTESCRPIKGEKVQLASVPRKTNKLSHILPAVIWALMPLQGALLPMGGPPPVVSWRQLTCVKSNAPGPSLQQKQKAQM